MTYIYNDDFMRYAATSSAYSAKVITSILSDQISVKSVLDVGCARGTWLCAWDRMGITDVHGVDGGYVDRQMLEIPESKFSAVNLGTPFDLGRQFDLVQSLEVGEHIETDVSDIFADNLARHARRYILFSAAPPGQGGEFHINEQPYEFWRKKIEERGFATADAIRPLILKDRKISYWYRYNTLLFIRRDLLAGIGESLEHKVLQASEQIKDVSPLLFRVRKAIVRSLPNVVQHKIAWWKAKLMPTGRI